MLEILDSLIATVTVVLILALIVQAIQRIIKQAFSMKAKYMERELIAIFQPGALSIRGLVSLKELCASDTDGTGKVESEFGQPRTVSNQR
jgi:hypothetical protein